MNPPWVKIGVDFIDKAVDHLNPNGKLICIIGYNQFTKINGKPGTFNNLQQRGFFEHIEVFKGMSQADYFNNNGQAVGDWCWFTWVKDPARKGNTTIVNRLKQSFDYTLKGNEFYVPQIPDETKYFDWDNGDRTISAIAKTKIKEEMTYVILRRSLTSSTFKKVRPSEILPSYGILFKITPPYVLKKLYKKIPLYQLFADSKSGDKLRCPPLRKDLKNILKGIK
jgi:hypothetical protein